jgi:predicted histidine transporter YuiF (NhaC family)
MSEPWTSLVAALVGAIVGGAASLASTMVVNKQQMATNARLRLYYELLPNLERAMESAILPQVPEDQVAEEQMPELLEEVQRARAIAGGF